MTLGLILHYKTNRVWKFLATSYELFMFSIIFLNNSILVRENEVLYNLLRTVTRIVFQTYGLLFSEIKKIVLTLC